MFHRCVALGLWLACTTTQAQVPFLRGDVNDDGRVSTTDAYYLSLWLHGGGLPPPCLKAADANDDGEITLNGVYRCDQWMEGGDHYVLVHHAVDEEPCSGDPCGFCRHIVAGPLDAPGLDPTPDGLTCESYTGRAAPLEDPAARIELLDATCPGGQSSLAILKLRISSSRAIGGYSCALDVSGIANQLLWVVNPDGVRLFGPYDHALRDGRLLLGCLADTTLGSQWPPQLRPGTFPPGEDQLSLKVYLRLEPGLPAGDYPLYFVEGEMADAATARTIAPGLIDGILSVEEDVAFDAAADLNVAGNWECGAKEAWAPAGPEDVQAAFEMASVPGERGATVRVPFWIRSNAPVEGFSFAVFYGNPEFNGRLRFRGLVPIERGGPWELFEHGGHPEGFALWGRAVFSSTDPAKWLPPGERHQVLWLEFEVGADAPNGQADIRCHDLYADPALPGRPDWRNGVIAYGKLLNKETATCFEYLTRKGGIVVGSSSVAFLRGDVNADGAISLADAILAGNVVLRSRLSASCEDAADADDDGDVNLSDALRLMRHVFEPPSAATEIASPFPLAGLDETLDPHFCEGYHAIPAAETADTIRIGSLEAAPGEPVEIPIHVSTARRLSGLQLLLRQPGPAWTLTGASLRLDGGAFEAQGLVGVNRAVMDLAGDRIAIGVALDLVREAAVPAGQDLLVGRLLGFVAEDLQPGDEIALEPLALAAEAEPRPDRRRSELVQLVNVQVVVALPRLEPGTIRIVDRNEPTFLRGDANGDLEVNISDPVFTLSYLFLGGREPPCVDAADADDSGRLELTDAVFTLGFLFGGDGARPLPPPYPEQGRDGERDGLAPCRDARG